MILWLKILSAHAYRTYPSHGYFCSITGNSSQTDDEMILTKYLLNDKQCISLQKAENRANKAREELGSVSFA